MDDNRLKQQKSLQHKCPNCGATLRFDPASGSLLCNHCGGKVQFDQSVDVQERDFSDLATFSRWDDGDVATYRCYNCGAVTVAPRTALATTCPYCNSPVVIDDKTGSLVKPDSLIPFQLTAKQAAQQLSRWRKRRLFAPNKFRKHTREDSVKGVFVPAWTFDATTTSSYNGTVGIRKTRTVRRNGKTYTESYIDWVPVSGVIDNTFDDVFIRANGNIPEKYFRALQPFPKQNYRVYSNEFLAGYIADHYTLEPLDAFSQAKMQMEQKIRRDILWRYGADVEGTLNVEMRFLSKSFKYMMVPVYVAATKYNKKVYNQYVSGIFSDDKQHSKVCGKAPVSPWKVLLTVLAGIAVIAGIVLLYNYLGDSNPADIWEDFPEWYSFLK